MKYRRAISQDIPRLIDMRISYLREDLGGMEPEIEQKILGQLTYYFRAHLNRDLRVYVAEEVHIIATVFLNVISKPASPLFPSGRTGNILNVYTSPEYRRRGVAETLIGMAIHDAEEENLAYIELKATKEGEFLYHKLGFEIENETYTAMKYKLKNSKK